MFSFMSRRRSRAPAAPVMPWDFTWSKGMPPKPSHVAGGELTFTMPAIPHSVHYLTRAHTARARTAISMTVRIDEAPGTTYDFRTNPNNTGTAPSAVRLFVQRAGDNWSGAGKFEFYRWWSNPQRIILGPGTHTITVPIDPSQWSSIYGKRDSTPFFACMNNLGRVGMTFGGGSFFGHGVRTATGSAQFTVLSFTVV